MDEPKGKLVFLNGCIRIMGNSNGVWITVYNSKFGKSSDGQYCKINYNGHDKFIIRKTNEFVGSKLYLLLSKSVGISISRRLLPEKIISKLSNKVIPIKVGVYLSDWGLSV